MERTIKEKMTITLDLPSAMPQDLINSKPVIAALKEFFGSSQLSQFMDQINSLSEVTHKRRLSALGPGGLSRERAGFEVRDIQASHYGRICPVETPEGPNIGLISSLSSYARVNEYGFIETPYRKVKDGRIIDYVKILHPGDSEFKVGDIVKQDEVIKTVAALKRKGAKHLPVVQPYCHYLTAWEEETHNIAQANARVDEDGRLLDDLVSRPAGRQLQDAAPGADRLHRRLAQAARLPFGGPRSLPGARRRQPRPDGLEHAASGRSAPPPDRPAASGTGVEHLVAKGSGDVIVCKRPGHGRFRRRRADPRPGRRGGQDQGLRGRDRPLRPDEIPPDQPEHLFHPAAHHPQGRPVVRGQVLADSSCTDMGELALGRNIVGAFMPWRGYNFEDAIVVSEKLIKNDIFTSLHIVEETIEARDTKLGPEDITRDIPNVPENVLRNLDENGIVRIGASVKAGDVLVGKVAPKGETQLSPEEKLLKAIFGEKALDVKDASLYCAPGVEGTIIDVRIFSRRGAEKGVRAKQIEKDEIGRMKRNLDDETSILESERDRKIKALLKGVVVEKEQKLGGS